jgi:hypothetical protein
MRACLTLALVAATSCGVPCTQPRALESFDGGVVVCVLATDCPRAPNVLVCGSVEDQHNGCVDCVTTQCVRYAKVECQ